MRFFRFAIVGVVNTGVHFAALNLFVRVCAFRPEVANVTAFALANVFSYFVNTHWTFKAKTGFRHYMRFLATSVVGLIISYGIMKAAVLLDLHYNYGFAAQCLLMPVINYVLLRCLVFKHQPLNS